jgi:hypothetical protein
LRQSASIDQATVNAELSRDFERRWSEPGGRETLAPGKEVLARLNAQLQEQYGVTVTDAQIASQFTRTALPADLVELLEMLRQFSTAEPPE